MEDVRCAALSFSGDRRNMGVELLREYCEYAGSTRKKNLERNVRRQLIPMVAFSYAQAVRFYDRGHEARALMELKDEAIRFMHFYLDAVDYDSEKDLWEPREIAILVKNRKIKMEKDILIEVLTENCHLIKNRYPASAIKEVWGVLSKARLAAGLKDSDESKLARRVSSWKAADADFSRRLGSVFKKFSGG